VARIRDLIDARLRDNDADAQLALVAFVVDNEDEFALSPGYVESLCRQYRTAVTERIAASLERDFGSQESRMAARILLRGSEPAPDDSEGWRWWLAANWCQHPDTMPDALVFMSRMRDLIDTVKIDQLVSVMRSQQPDGIELLPEYERLRSFVKGAGAADPELARTWFPRTTAHGESNWVKLGDYVDRRVVIANLPILGGRARDPLELLGLLIAAYAPGLDDYEMTPPDDPMRDRLLASILWTLDIDQAAWWAALELWASHHGESGGTVSDLARAAGLNQENGNQR